MSPSSPPPPQPNPLIPLLSKTLTNIHTNPPSPLPTPLSLKRASIALIIRIRPPYPHQPPSFPPLPSPSTTSTLTAFLQHPTILTGVPEILFIKRAARPNDRWTSHVAFPGGKREASDASDWATSVRETGEEIGLDLEGEGCVSVGALRERVISASWGRVPLMVLCPFVFLLTRFEIPPLVLQPAEVASAHWVPVSVLLETRLRTVERTDVSDRLVVRRGEVVKRVVRGLMGQMVFSATRLVPSESVYCSSAAGFLPDLGGDGGWLSGIWAGILGKGGRGGQERSLVLWGLTCGVVADLLEGIDPVATASLWSWPTFSHWDIRLVVWLLTYRYRAQRARDLQKASNGSKAGQSDESTVASVDGSTVASSATRPESTGAGLAGAHLLDAYFERMRTAVIVAFGLRFGAGFLAVLWLIRKYRNRVNR